MTSSLARTLCALPQGSLPLAIGEGEGGDPPDWVVVDDITGHAGAGHALARIGVGGAAGDPAVTGAYAAMFLSSATIGPVVLAAVGLGRGWAVSPASVALRWYAGGWFDRSALSARRIWVLGDDDLAGASDTDLLRSEAELYERVADAIVETFTAVFAALSGHVRYEVHSMWGHALDAAHRHALEAAQFDPQREARKETQRFLDVLIERMPATKARPRALAVPGDTASAARELMSVKGTCCLMFRTLSPALALVDSCCGACPRVSDEARIARRLGGG